MRAIRMVIASVLLAAAANAGAQAPVEPGKGESVLTMRVDGELSIDPDGRVMDYRIASKLDPQLQKLVQRVVPSWRFKPILVDGKAVVAKTPMRITLKAEEMAEGYRVTVDNVVFRPNTQKEYEAEQASRKAHPRISVAGEAPAPQVWITSKQLQPPKYPPGLQRSGVEGIVLLSLRLNPDGTVAEVFASQSSLLNVKGREKLLDRARVMLEHNASDVAKHWTFRVEAENPEGLAAKNLTVRVPVSYNLSPSDEATDGLAGKWRQEFRGPNLATPWLSDAKTPKVGVSDLNGNEMLAGVSPFELSDNSIIGKAL